MARDFMRFRGVVLDCVKDSIVYTATVAPIPGAWIETAPSKRWERKRAGRPHPGGVD